MTPMVTTTSATMASAATPPPIQSPTARNAITAVLLPPGFARDYLAGKQFAQFRNNHHGDHKTVVCVRVSSLDEQAMLLEADPDTYSKPAYLPSWVSINVAGESVDWDHVADRIAQSWELAAPRRLLEAGGR